MSLPSLYAIIDQTTADRRGWSLPDLARACLSGGARLVQLRAPTVGSGVLLEWCDLLVSDADGFDARVVVNDRADVAVMAHASGVHVGQNDLPVAAVRRIVGAGALVGLSTHNRQQVDAGMTEPVDYIAVGPVFQTSTKDTGYRPVGLDLVRYAACHPGGRPVVAIGGITLDRARDVMDAGATTLAVVSDLLSGGDPERRVGDYLRTLSGSSK